MRSRTMSTSPQLNGKTRGHEFEAAFESPLDDQDLERARLWDVSIDLLGVLGAHGYFESTNPAWGRALGWTAEEIRQTSLFELIHPDDVEKVRTGLRDVAAGEPV